MRLAAIRLVIVGLGLLLAVGGGAPVHAQEDTDRVADPCGRLAERGCRAALMTEATFARRVNAAPDLAFAQDAFLAASLGILKPLGPGVGVGMMATVGILDDLLFALGPRLRLRVATDLAADLTPQLVLAGGRVDAGHLLLDASLMHRDRVGISLQANWTREFVATSTYPFWRDAGRRPVVHAGLRLGSKPGRYGMALGAVASLVLGLVVAATWSN